MQKLAMIGISSYWNLRHISLAVRTIYLSSFYNYANEVGCLPWGASNPFWYAIPGNSSVSQGSAHSELAGKTWLKGQFVKLDRVGEQSNTA